jgi:hypothetical protein
MEASMADIDPRSVQWAEKYKKLLAGYTEGNRLTPLQREIVENVVTLQVELSMLTNRFLASGRGGEPADIALFLKLSNTVAELLNSAGLGPSQIAVASKPDESAKEKLQTIFSGLLAQRRAEAEQAAQLKAEEEQRGVFRDGGGTEISNPAELRLLRELHALRHGPKPAPEEESGGCNAFCGMPPEAEPEPPAPEPPTKPSSNVVPIKPIIPLVWCPSEGGSGHSFSPGKDWRGY